MSQAMVTVIVRLDADKVADAKNLIDTMLRNPAKPAGPGDSLPTPADRLAGPAGGEFVHFASLHVIESGRPEDGAKLSSNAYLVLEFTADMPAKEALAEFVARISDHLLPVYLLAKNGLTEATLTDFLWKHRVVIGHGLFSTPGLAFPGTPEQSVADILAEQILAKRVAEEIAEHGAEPSALDHLKAVKTALGSGASPIWPMATLPPIAKRPEKEPSVTTQFWALGPSFIATFLWPAIVVLIVLASIVCYPFTEGWTVRSALFALLYASLLVVLGTLVTVVIAYALLREAEKMDVSSDASISLEHNRAMFARENAVGYAQNHMISHTMRKPGLIRMLTIRIAFWAIERLTALNPRAGHLGEIGTIHFARWVTIPRTRSLLFMSNYGGSWESYLEDFITKAHNGLTAVWSNTLGFPRTTNLFQDGATDGERFKRFARESMRFTPFWYSAYPGLTTDNIRTNRLVRRGLETASTETEASEWLALFGSRARPAAKLDTTQIQSIVFGGLGFKREGRVLTVRLKGLVDSDKAISAATVAANRRWLRGLLPSLSFNDGRYIEASAVISVALTERGLTNLGLPDSAMETFPAAFRLGMRGEGRARILGDDDTVPGGAWWWGAEPLDAVLLVYGDSQAALDETTRKIAEQLELAGEIIDRIELTKVGKTLADRKEPFGFVDGVSQPAIRGTYRGMRNADPVHLVEPGEFIVGYPDNRGNIPPQPVLAAKDDPERLLPLDNKDHCFGSAYDLSPRLAGFNGSYLVIRQLEQDSDGFERYCERQAKLFDGRFPAPAICDAEFIGAKMIGRWKDGSSLARNPYMSASKLRDLYGSVGASQLAREKTNPAEASAAPIDAADRASAATADREEITPDNDYLFGTEDPQGLHCPYGAHVRRANPRDSLSPGSMQQVEITNRHRIIRIGRGFGADPVRGRKSGLMFMCLNGDIERQFEFVQQSWMGSVKFHGLNSETDPIAVSGQAGSNGFTIPVRTGPVALESLPRFVTMRGGGYFFLPGRQLLNYLST